MLIGLLAILFIAISGSTAWAVVTGSGPVIVRISPTEGPQEGGTAVTVYGTGFTGVTDVTFGGNAGASLSVTTDSELTVTTPAGTGTASVVVQNANGSSNANVTFTYLAPPTTTPIVSSVSPESGPESGGTEVTLLGENFTGVTSVKFGGTEALSFSVNSDTELTAIVPAGTDTVDVVVTNTDGESLESDSGSFTYVRPAPSVTSVSPDSGPASGGTAVTISGEGFTGATDVLFTGISATSFVVDSDTQITAVTPAGLAGFTAFVQVETPVGTSDIHQDTAFLYLVDIAEVGAERAEELNAYFRELSKIILAQVPGSQRRVNRLKGTPAPAANPAAALMGYLPQLASGSAELSGSLSAAEALAASGVDPRLDIWFEGTFGHFEGGDRSGEFGVGSIGLDYLVTPDLLLGGFVQADLFAPAEAGDGSTIASSGWLAGPYLTTRLIDNVYFDVMLGAGTGVTEFDPDGTYTDTVASTRWLGSASLTGNLDFGDLSFAPHLSLSHFGQQTEDYTDGLGNDIDAMTASVTRLAVGPSASYRLSDNGIVVDLDLGLDGLYEIQSDESDTQTDAGLQASAGIRLGFGGGASLDLSTTMDAFEASSSLSGSARFSAPLH